MLQPLRERLALALIALSATASATLLTRLAFLSAASQRAYWLEGMQWVMLAVFVVGSSVLLIRRRVSRVMWEGVLAAASVVGMWYAVFLTGLSVGASLVVIGGLSIFAAFMRRIVVHDLLYLIGAVGLGIALATWVPWQILIAGLVCFAAYDTVAAPAGGAIRSFARKFSSRSVLPGMIVPVAGQGWFAPISEADRERATMVGVGDLMFLSALASQFTIAGPRNGLLVIAGCAAGGCFGIALARERSSRFVLLAIASSVSLVTMIVVLVQFFVR